MDSCRFPKLAQRGMLDRHAVSGKRVLRVESLEDRRLLAVGLKPLGTFESGIFDGSAAEIVAHDPETQRLFVTNAAEATLDVIDMSKPQKLERLAQIPMSTLDLSGVTATELAGPTSVSVANGLVAVSVLAQPYTDPGVVAFFDADGNWIDTVEVGFNPDMLTFTPDGSKVLVANEGQPSDDYTIDPPGSVSIVDVADLSSITVTSAEFTAFNEGQPRHDELPDGVRIFGPKIAQVDETTFVRVGDASVAEDLEPEYIAVSPDSTTAWVTLQENNAIGILNIADANFTSIVALGYKDHMADGNALDASDRDGAINITQWPVHGMFLPDAIVSYTAEDGNVYLVTANEGDSRDYETFSEEERVGSYEAELVDAPTLPEGERYDLSDVAGLADSLLEMVPDLAARENLGRLLVTLSDPATFVEVAEEVPVVVDNPGGENDGEFIRTETVTVRKLESLYSFGTRSFTIWDADGTLVFDSGDQIEQITAALLPDYFNSTNNDNDSFDNRSDDKGPEPESVSLGEMDGRMYAFVALERIGGIMVYDVTDPEDAQFVTYVNNRDFSVPLEIPLLDEDGEPVLDEDGEPVMVVNPDVGDAGDLAPEGVKFIPAYASPTGKPMLAVANEISGTTTLFRLIPHRQNWRMPGKWDPMADQHGKNDQNPSSAQSDLTPSLVDMLLAGGLC